MNFRRARMAFFSVMLMIFSANYFLWGLRLTSSASPGEFYLRYARLKHLTGISQFTHVFDSPYYFISRNEVQLTYADGHRASERLEFQSFRNPVDALFFIHGWNWLDRQDATITARKDRLLRLHFCRPGVKFAEWKIYYLEDALTIDLGRTSC